MLDLFDPSAVGHEHVEQGGHLPPASGQRGKVWTTEDLLSELTQLAQMMSREIKDDQGRLRGDVTLRDVRETATVSRDLLTLLARNQELFARNRSIDIIQSAVVEALKELDAKGRTQFLEAFDRHVELFSAKARAA